MTRKVVRLKAGWSLYDLRRSPTRRTPSHQARCVFVRCARDGFVRPYLLYHPRRCLLLKAGGDGRAKAIVVGKGANLNLPGPVGSTYFNQDMNVTVQLVKGDGSVCWEAVYSASAIRNQADLLKDKCGAGSEPPC